MRCNIIIQNWILIVVDRYKTSNIKSSRPKVLCEHGVLKNFAKFTGKHQYQSLFFSKIVGAACNFIKKETLSQVFSFEFCKIFKSNFFHRTPPVAASVILNVLCSGLFNIESKSKNKPAGKFSICFIETF